jgi:hypothetical protein
MNLRIVLLIILILFGIVFRNLPAKNPKLQLIFCALFSIILAVITIYKGVTHEEKDYVFQMKMIESITRPIRIDPKTGNFYTPPPRPIKYEPPKRYAEKALSIIFAISFIGLSFFCVNKAFKIKSA